MVGYNQVFPQVQPLDIGNTLFKIAQLKDAEETRGYRNSLLALQTKEAQQKLDDRNALRTALPGAMSGDADASSQVAAINPELWMKLDANKKAKIKQDLETTGRLLYSVEQSADKPAAYQAARAQAKTLGLDISKVPEQYDPNWVRSNIAAATSLSDQIKLSEGQKPQVVAPGGALVGRDGNVIFQNPDRTQAPVTIPDDKSPTGFRYGTREEALGQPALGPSGLSMEFGPDGKPTRIMSGPGAAKGGGGGLTTTNATDVNKQLIEMTGLLAQTSEINRTFDPQNQTVGKRISMMWAAGKDRFNSASPDDQRALADYTTQRAAASQLFADRLKAMSGSAVTPQEMKRQEAYLPTPGTGILDGDSPSEFSAKAHRMHDFFQRATARLAYVSRNSGLGIKDVPLDKMPSIIQQRGDVLAGELSKQGVKGDALKNAVKRQLATEFGLVSE